MRAMVGRRALLWASENETLRRALPRLPAVRGVLARYMPGERLADAIAAARRLAAVGIPTTFTHLGENVVDEAEADHVVAEYESILETVHTADLDTEISVKLTHLGLDLGADLAEKNLARLVGGAAETGNRVWIDMESSAYVDRTLDLFEIVQETGANVGICLQAYLRRTESDVTRLPVSTSIRLVKGAYREPSELLVGPKGAISDRYVELARRILDRQAGTAARLALATHDVALLHRVEREAGAARTPLDAAEIQMLYGIRPDEQTKIARSGRRIRVLIAYGAYWYPWFMRRLAERPSNALLVLRGLLDRG